MADDAKVGIIGAGPAGISAGVQLARYGIRSMIFERRKIGGLIENAYLVENTMLFPEGIKGTEVVKILERYASLYSLDIRFEEVTRVKKEENFLVETSRGVYEFPYLIVATGTNPRKLKFPCVRYHVADLVGDHFERVLIIGGGDIAFDYALTVSEMSDEVIILHRSDVKALPVLVDMVRQRENIRVLRGEVLNISRGCGSVETTVGKFSTDVVLAAVGRIPNLDIVEGIEDERMFVIGDAKNGIFRQSSIAIGDGIRAAMKIWRCERYGDCGESGR